MHLALALGTLSLFAWLYGRGGGDHKTLYRRILGAAVYNAGCLLLAVWTHHASMWMLLGFPGVYGWLTMPYGADTLGAKLRARALYGLVGGAISGFWLLPLGLWSVWLFQIGLAIATSIFYGTVNPHSRLGEEAAIALLSVACAPLALLQ